MPIANQTDPQFPTTQIRAALKLEWAEQTGSCSKTGDPFATQAGGSVMDLQPAMDSLTAVTTLLVIEEFVPFKLPAEIVMKGGYLSEERFLEHLVGQVRKLWGEHYGIPDVKSVHREKEVANG